VQLGCTAPAPIQQDAASETLHHQKLALLVYKQLVVGLCVDVRPQELTGHFVVGTRKKTVAQAAHVK
jgi:hypothetical protein